jgi:cysteine desulfurase family protein (TIGR01976 family)
MSIEITNKHTTLADRNDFPALSRTVNGLSLAFFDGPAGVQVPTTVIEAVSGYYQHHNANVHGAFITSHETETELLLARKYVSEFLGASSPDCISFGANMTTLTFSLSRAIGRSLDPDDEILITQLDHEANRGPWIKLQEQGIRVREARMLPGGRLDLEDLASKLTHRTKLVAVGFASNALGTVNDIRAVRELSRQFGSWLLIDAVHYAPHFPIDFSETDAEFLLCSAYKFYGPHVGILCSKRGMLDQLETDLLRTQKQRAPFRIETGTLNHAAIAGVRAAIEYIAEFGSGENLRARLTSAMQSIGGHEQPLAKLLYESLKEIPGVVVHGPGFDGPRAPTVSFTIPGVPPRQIARQLGQKGILVWDGHFYAARLVEVLGLADSGGLVRVGMSIYLSRADVERLVAEVARIADGRSEG